RQARGVLPDGLALVLCRKGKYKVPEQGTSESALGWLPPEEVLAAPDVGVVPLVPLMAFDGPPGPLLRRCRERIDHEAGTHRANMLAVAQTLTKLRFPQQEFLDLFGGSRAMIESPLIKEIVEKTEQQTRRTDIEDLIRGRFVPLSDDAR